MQRIKKEKKRKSAGWTGVNPTPQLPEQFFNGWQSFSPLVLPKAFKVSQWIRANNMQKNMEEWGTGVYVCVCVCRFLFATTFL